MSTLISFLVALAIGCAVGAVIMLVLGVIVISAAVKDVIANKLW